VGRRLFRSGLDLTIYAALDAIADAGLTTGDIDGSTYPGSYRCHRGSRAGNSRRADALRLRSTGIAADRGRSAARPWSAVLPSALARHVLVYRTVTESSAQAAGREGIGLSGGGGGGGVPKMGGSLQWSIPFRATSLRCIASSSVSETGQVISSSASDRASRFTWPSKSISLPSRTEVTS
jgi:hypothetical protein